MKKILFVSAFILTLSAGLLLNGKDAVSPVVAVANTQAVQTTQDQLPTATVEDVPTAPITETIQPAVAVTIEPTVTDTVIPLDSLFLAAYPFIYQHTPKGDAFLTSFTMYNIVYGTYNKDSSRFTSTNIENVVIECINTILQMKASDPNFRPMHKTC